MSYSFYYPYFSARTDLPDPILPPNTTERHSYLRQHLHERQLAVSLKEQQLQSRRLDQIHVQQMERRSRQLQINELSFQANREEEHPWGMGRTQDRMEELNYSQHLQHMQQKEYHDHSFEMKKPQAAEFKEEQENNRKIEQYQQELLEKIQTCRSHRKPTARQNQQISIKQDYSYRNPKTKQSKKQSSNKNCAQAATKVTKAASRYLSVRAQPDIAHSMMHLDDYKTIDYSTIKDMHSRTKPSTHKKKRKNSMQQPQYRHINSHSARIKQSKKSSSINPVVKMRERAQKSQTASFLKPDLENQKKNAVQSKHQSIQRSKIDSSCHRSFIKTQNGPASSTKVTTSRTPLTENRKAANK